MKLFLTLIFIYFYGKNRYGNIDGNKYNFIKIIKIQQLKFRNYNYFLRLKNVLFHFPALEPVFKIKKFLRLKIIISDPVLKS